MPSLRGSFSEQQRKWLMAPILKIRVSTTQQGMSYVEAHDDLAHLSRIFGFEGWDKELLFCDMIFEDYVTWTDKKTQQQKQGWDVAYKAGVKLTVFDPEGIICTVKEDGAVGDAAHQPSRADAHHLALTTAISTALKRAAKDLGDQFGLSLYDKGSLAASIAQVVPYEAPAGDGQLVLE